MYINQSDEGPSISYCRKVLDAMMKKLTKDGNGNRNYTEEFTLEDENSLWDKGVLSYSGKGLLNLKIKSNIYFRKKK